MVIAHSMNTYLSLYCVEFHNDYEFKSKDVSYLFFLQSVHRSQQNFHVTMITPTRHHHCDYYGCRTTTYERLFISLNVVNFPLEQDADELVRTTCFVLCIEPGVSSDFRIHSKGTVRKNEQITLRFTVRNWTHPSYNWLRPTCIIIVISVSTVRYRVTSSGLSRWRRRLNWPKGSYNTLDRAT